MTPAPILPPSFNLAICGEAGEGVFRAGDLLTLLASRLSLEALAERQSPSEFQGAQAVYRLRLGKRLPRTVEVPLDLLIAFDAASFKSARDSARRGGICIIDADGGEIEADEGRVLEVSRAPIRQLTQEACGNPRAQAYTVAGCVAGLLNFPVDAAARIVNSAEVQPRIPNDKERAGRERAFRAGYQFTQHHFAGRVPRLAEQFPERDASVVSVLAEVAAGLSAAGVRFAAGVSDAAGGECLAALAREIPQNGAAGRPRVFAAETASAAASMAVGASFGGVPSVWITAGSGLGSGGEICAQACVAELPLVVVVVQQPGPWGSHPGVEQSELLSTIHGGPTQTPRAVLAVSDHATAAETAYLAVRIAETYQIPVFLLLDGRCAAQMGTRVSRFGDAHAPVTRRDARGALNRLRRYEPTPTGVSPIPSPGEAGMGYLATMRDHDSDGRRVQPGRARDVGVQKRWRKLEALRHDLELSEAMLGASATTEIEEYEAVVIGWGMTAGPIAEAVSLASREGIRALHIHPRALHPLPTRLFARVRDRFEERNVLVFEENPTGEFARHLRAELGVRAQSVHRGDGLPMRAADVLARLKAVFEKR